MYNSPPIKTNLCFYSPEQNEGFTTTLQNIIEGLFSFTLQSIPLWNSSPLSSPSWLRLQDFSLQDFFCKINSNMPPNLQFTILFLVLKIKFSETGHNCQSETIVIHLSADYFKLLIIYTDPDLMFYFLKCPCFHFFLSES